MKMPKLKTRLILEEQFAAPDGAGGETDAWIAIGEHNAELTAQGVSEGERAAAGDMAPSLTRP